MAKVKSVHADVLDASLDYIEANADKMTICSTIPTTYTEAVTTYMIAEHAMTSGDYTVASDGAAGRKITVAAQLAVTVSNTGTSGHIALVDVGSTELMYVTTCNALLLTAAESVDIGEWVITIAAPV